MWQRTSRFRSFVWLHSLESVTEDGEEFTLRGFTDNRQGAGLCRAVEGVGAS